MKRKECEDVCEQWESDVTLDTQIMQALSLDVSLPSTLGLPDSSQPNLHPPDDVEQPNLHPPDDVEQPNLHPSDDVEQPNLHPSDDIPQPDSRMDPLVIRSIFGYIECGKHFSTRMNYLLVCKDWNLWGHCIDPRRSIHEFIIRDIEANKKHEHEIWFLWNYYAEKVFDRRFSTCEDDSKLLQWAVLRHHPSLVLKFLDVACNGHRDCLYLHKHYGTLFKELDWGNLYWFGFCAIINILDIAQLPVPFFGVSPDPLEIVAEVGTVEHVKTLLRHDRYICHPELVEIAFATTVRARMLNNAQAIVENSQLYENGIIINKRIDPWFINEMENKSAPEFEDFESLMLLYIDRFKLHPWYIHKYLGNATNVTIYVGCHSTSKYTHPNKSLATRFT